jgi:hypothetical protein
VRHGTAQSLDPEHAGKNYIRRIDRSTADFFFPFHPRAWDTEDAILSHNSPRVAARRDNGRDFFSENFFRRKQEKFLVFFLEL